MALASAFIDFSPGIFESVNSKNQPKTTTMKTKNPAIQAMEKPLLILKKITDKENSYGYDTIRIWQFNYDGEGTALVSFDNEAEFDTLHRNDVFCVLCGSPFDGHRCYRPVNLAFTSKK